MKHWTKKLLALALVAMMMIPIIPMGTWNVGALDYTQSEFTIASVSDWNDIASATQSFAGKTVKLTQNFDANGATLAPLFDNFSGTFDGQGYTIKNFEATDALIAKTTTAGAVIKNLKVDGAVNGSADTGVGMLIGSHDGTGALTVTDVTVNGTVTSTGKHAGGIIGVLTLKDAQTAVLANIKANVTVTNTKTVPTNEMSGTGGVIGIYEPIGKPSLTLSGLNLSGSVSSKASVGGVIGAVFSTKTLGSTNPHDNDISWNNGWDNSYISDITTAELYTGGSIVVANCESALALSTNIATELIGAGGIVGTFGGYRRYFGDNFSFDGELNINNCVIGGSIKNTSGATHPSSVGGVLGAMSYSHADVKIEHCLITASFPSNSLTGTKGEGAGLVLGTSACQTMSELTVNNCVTTAESFALIGSIVAKAGGGKNVTGAWLVLNGKSLTATEMSYHFLDEDSNYLMYSTYSWNYSASVTDTSVLTVSADTATAMVQKNEAGLIKRVGGQVTALAVQDNVPDGATLSSTDTYAIRFIGITQVKTVGLAKMTVVVRNAATGKAFRKYEKQCTLYDALNAYDVNGARIGYYKAQDFDAKKILGLTIGDIPGGTAYTFDFTPSYTDRDGFVVTGETVSITYDQNGQYVPDRASFDVAPLVTAPTVRIMSSNLMIEDPVTYNIDNVHNTTGEVYDSSKDFGNAPKYYTDPALANYKNSGKCYQMYMRDDTWGDYIGRINKVAGTGWNISQRLQAMAKMYLHYEPDFIGLQEVTGSPKVNNVQYMSGNNMQSALLSYMGSNYAYVDFTDKVAKTAHTTPIMYRSDKWTVLDKNIATDTGCEMHRWQWALFESKANPQYRVIVVNLHGHTSGCNKYDAFYSALNAELKKLEANYSGVPIMITGDYNLNSADSRLTTTLIDGTTVKNSLDLTVNSERCTTDIDHIFVSSECATVEQLRVISNHAAMTRATDHPNVFADILLAKPVPPEEIPPIEPEKENSGAFMDWNDG